MMLVFTDNTSIYVLWWYLRTMLVFMPILVFTLVLVFTDNTGIYDGAGIYAPCWYLADAGSSDYKPRYCIDIVTITTDS